MRTSILVLLVSAGAAGPAARLAEACSVDAGTECGTPQFAPGDGHTVPQNVPGLPYRPVWDSPPNANSVELLDAQGAAVPIDLVTDPAVNFSSLVVPKAPLAPGSYQVRLGTGCHGATSTSTQTFVVAAANPPLAALGTVAVSTAIEHLSIPDPGLCQVDADASVARLTVTPSPDLVAYQAVTMYTLTVDGRPLLASPYGGGVAGPPRLDIIYGTCDGSHGLTLGKHRGELAVHVAGASQDPPPVGFDFELSCSSPAPAAKGCAMGGSGSSSTALGLLAAAALWLWRARRRSA